MSWVSGGKEILYYLFSILIFFFTPFLLFDRNHSLNEIMCYFLFSLQQKLIYLSFFVKMNGNESLRKIVIYRKIIVYRFVRWDKIFFKNWIKFERFEHDRHERTMAVINKSFHIQVFHSLINLVWRHLHMQHQKQ